MNLKPTSRKTANYKIETVQKNDDFNHRYYAYYWNGFYWKKLDWWYSHSAAEETITSHKIHRTGGGTYYYE